MAECQKNEELRVKNEGVKEWRNEGMKEWRDGGMLKRVSVESFNYGLCGAQKCRGNPCDCPNVFRISNVILGVAQTYILFLS